MAPRQIDAVEAETRATSAASNLTTCVDAEHHGMIADGFALGDLAVPPQFTTTTSLVWLGLMA